MSHTVVGIFNNAEEARKAVDELVNRGFDRSNIDYGRGSASAYNTDDENHNDRNDSETGIGRFFKNLFDDKDESDRYSRVAKNGCVITVHAQSPGEAHRASELLDEYGAVDVNEKDREYGMRNSNTMDNNNYTDHVDRLLRKMRRITRRLIEKPMILILTTRTEIKKARKYRWLKKILK